MLDMSKFWTSLEKATADLGGTHFTEWEMYGGAARRWPNVIRTATAHTPDENISLHYVDCYGWCVSKREPKKKKKKLYLSPKFKEMFKGKQTR